MSRNVGYESAITSEETWGDFWNRKHLLLNPIAVSTVVGLGGVVCALTMPLWWETLALVGALGGGVFVWTVANLHNRAQRAFYRGVIAVSALWMFMLHSPLAAAYKLDFFIGWVVVTVFGLIFYGTDQREKRKIAITREVQAWPAIAATLGIPKAKITQKKEVPAGSERKIWWDLNTGYTVSQILGLAERLESMLGIPRGQARLREIKDENGHTDSNSVLLVESSNSATRKAPVPFKAPSMKSITDKMLIGPFENDTDNCEMEWYRNGYGGAHAVAGGVTRSGKSGLYRLLLAESAEVNDLVRWGIDAKGGMALRPWSPLFDWLICGNNNAARDEQLAMLERLNAIIAYRSLLAAERGWDPWPVTPATPLIILFVDEAAEVYGVSYDGASATELVEKIHRMGAGVGVLVCSATQYPTVEALGSSQISSQIGLRFCFRMENSTQQQVILPSSTRVNATFPDKPSGEAGGGWFYLKDRGHLIEIPARVRWVERSKIYGIVAAGVGKMCQLDAGSAGISTRAKEYAARRRWTLDDISPDRLEGVRIDEYSTEPTKPAVAAPIPATMPGTVSLFEGTELGTQAGTQMGTESVTAGTQTGDSDRGLDGTELVMPAEDWLPDIPLSLLAQSGSEADRVALAASVAAYEESTAQWSAERSVAAFWATLEACSPRPGVKLATLTKACHRSPSWTSGRMQDAREAGQIEPVERNSSHYRIKAGAEIPTLAHAE